MKETEVSETIISNTLQHTLEESGIHGVYVIHAKKGYEYHENRINQLFGELGLNHEFVTDGDVSNFTPSLLDKYFSPEIYDHISEGVLSCTLNHILSYEKMVRNQNKYALIFENDVVFLGDFMKDIISVAKECDSKEPGFIISLENTTLQFPSYRKIKKGKWLYEAPAGRCAGAYLIDLHAARTILKDLESTKCMTVIDWWHTSMINRNVMKVYWAHPPLTEQGSHNGMMSSTISSKKKNPVRRLKWLAQKYYKTYFLRFFK